MELHPAVDQAIARCAGTAYARRWATALLICARWLNDSSLPFRTGLAPLDERWLNDSPLFRCDSVPPELQSIIHPTYSSSTAFALALSAYLAECQQHGKLLLIGIHRGSTGLTFFNTLHSLLELRDLSILAALTGSDISAADDANVREARARKWPDEWGYEWGYHGGYERHPDDIEDTYDSDDPDSDFEDHVAHDNRIFLERFLRSMGDGSGDGELADAEA